jgi:hypothetical protein
MSYPVAIHSRYDCGSVISSLPHGSILPDPNYHIAPDNSNKAFVPPREIVVHLQQETPDWLRFKEGEQGLRPNYSRVSSAPSITPAPSSSPMFEVRRQISWDARRSHTQIKQDDNKDDFAASSDPTTSTDVIRCAMSMLTAETTPALGSFVSSDEDDETAVITVRKKRGSFRQFTYLTLFRGRRKDVRLRRSRGCFT